MQLGPVIASFRKKKMVDQKELAAALGVSITYISLIENNKKNPSASLLKSIADYFGVPVSVLLLTALHGPDFKSKKDQETFKMAGSLINKMVDFLISDKDTRKNTAKPSPKKNGKGKRSP